MQSSVKMGDFSSLAEDYAKYRPGYSESVVSALLGLMDRPARDLTAVDVGAGTGIFTRMLANRGCTVTAVEPNDAMRGCGMRESSPRIRWVSGSGEDTGLHTSSCDLLTMASSFHWVEFDRGTAEFHRVLRTRGRFVALWNTRDLAASPLLYEIEQRLAELAPDLDRVSSGGSSRVNARMDDLGRSPWFEDLVYIEGRHVVRFTPRDYEGVWRSVNDVRAQLGPERFERFLAYVRERTSALAFVEATYLTRAWSVRKRDRGVP